MKTHLETFRRYVRGGYHGLIGQYLVCMCSQGSPLIIQGGYLSYCWIFMTYCNNIHHKPPSRMTLVVKTHLETFRGYVRGGYHGLIGQYLVCMCSQGSPPKIEGGPRKSCNYLPPLFLGRRSANGVSNSEWLTSGLSTRGTNGKLYIYHTC